MKVKAKAMGQYNGAIQDAGSIFEIKDTPSHMDRATGKILPVEFSSKWMEQVEEKKPVEKKPDERRQDENRGPIEEQLKAKKLGVA